MKKTILLSFFIILTSIQLTGCGWGGCSNLCGGSNYVFNYQGTSCCSGVPW